MLRFIQTLVLISLIPFFATAQNSTNNPCPASEVNCEGKQKFADGSTYNGSFRFGKAHGAGIMTFADGSRFEGDWKSGEMSYGSLFFENGDEYLGEFKNNKMAGTGSMIRENGDTYSGGWLDGSESGEGLISFEDGSTYNGTFENGVREGKGLLLSASKDTLTAVWKDGKIFGQSTLKFANGDILVNEWKNGRMKVNGIYTFDDGKEISGTMTTIYYIITLEDEFDFESIENSKNNMEIAWYSYGMEFRSNQNYDLASNFIGAAQKYGSPNSDNKNMIVNAIERISKEQKDKGLAKKE